MFHDFIANCLIKEPKQRPNATAMLQVKGFSPYNRLSETCKRVQMPVHQRSQFEATFMMQRESPPTSINHDYGSCCANSTSMEVNGYITVPTRNSLCGCLVAIEFAGMVV